MIRQYLANRRQKAAQRELQRLVDEAARSPETISYRINRARGKLSWRTRREGCA